MGNEPFHNPFGALKGLGRTTADGQVSDDGLAEPAAPVAPVSMSARGIARAVVRMERAGRGGKEVTVIEQLGLDATTLDTWLKHLKTALGCGGAVEGDAIALQGDHRPRLPALLTARGVKKVTVG
jgi:translation initiation factor 1